MRNLTPLLLLAHTGCFGLLGGLIDDPLEVDETFGFIEIDGERHGLSTGDGTLQTGPVSSLSLNLAGSDALTGGLLGEGVGLGIIVVDDAPIGPGVYPLLPEKALGTQSGEVQAAAGVFAVTTALSGLESGEDWGYCSSIADDCDFVGKEDLDVWLEQVTGFVEITGLGDVVSLEFEGTLVGEGRTRTSGDDTVERLGPILASVEGEVIEAPVTTRSAR